MVKITLLMAECTSEALVNSLDIIQKVLIELDIEVHKIELTNLLYFNGNKNKQSEAIMNDIKESKGVIAVTSIPLITMHGAMQSFFDTASLYSEEYFDKPLLAISYSNSLGEQEVANTMQRCWSVLGGRDGGKIYLNSQIDINSITGMLEREVEDFYRLMKQDRVVIKSSEYMIFKSIKNGVLNNNDKVLKDLNIETGTVIDDTESKVDDINGEYPKIRTFADMIRNETESAKGNVSTKEKNIKEITSMIKKDSNISNGENNTEESFKQINSGVYTRPPRHNNSVVKLKKIEQIPHFFIAQHEVDLKLILKYYITNTNKTAYIIIQEGDCVYCEDTNEPITVELMLSEEVLDEIIDSKITYQKAFMLGKLKVKGNFAVLPKIDKIFKKNK